MLAGSLDDSECRSTDSLRKMELGTPCHSETLKPRVYSSRVPVEEWIKRWSQVCHVTLPHHSDALNEIEFINLSSVITDWKDASRHTDSQLSVETGRDEAVWILRNLHSQHQEKPFQLICVSTEISSAFNIVMIILSFCPKMVAKPGVVVSSVTSQFE